LNADRTVDWSGEKVDDDSLEVKVRNWLLRSGYPLEMRVFEAFSIAEFLEWRDGTFELYPSSFYIDQDSGRQREVDLIASWVRNHGNDDYHVTLTIECKSTTDPWVVFKHRNDGVGGYNDLFDPSCATIRANSPEVSERALLTHVAFESVFAGLESGWSDYVTAGYTVATAFKERNSRDSADAAIRQVLSGAIHAGVPDGETLRTGRWISYTVPIVITTSPIFEAAIIDGRHSGDVELRKVDFSIVHAPMPGQAGVNTATVYLFNEAALPILLEQCHALQRALTRF
jgi:hypothetical protein